MNKNIILKIGMINLMIIVFLSLIVSAFSVSMPSLPVTTNGDRAFYILPGEEKGITFTVQNGGGATTEVESRADILEGSDVIRWSDSNNIFVIPAGGRVEISAVISIPSSSQLGESKDVVISFGVSGEPGTFTFGSNIQQRFRVIVGEEPRPQPENVLQETSQKGFSKLSIIISIAILIVLVIIIKLIIKRNKK